MTYAEAKVELNALTQTDLDKSVNLLRQRMGMPDLSMAEGNAAPGSFLMTLSVRAWFCGSCGEIHDRGVNAVKNILIQGIKVLSGWGYSRTQNKNGMKRCHWESL